MSVVIQQAQGIITAPSAPFENELELERILAERVQLLEVESDRPLAFVARQVGLEAGPLDLLCVDAEGLPVAIEVKLRKNGESRRKVIAQIVDYLSALTAMTVDELDKKVDGKLEAALKTFDDEVEEEGFERRWEAVGMHLRAGRARIIVAIDEGPADLKRIVRFLSEHSNLDIRLLEVSKYIDSGVGTIYVPSVIVRNEGEPLPRPGTKIVPCDTFTAAWKASAGPVVSAAWDEFIAALESSGIEGLHVGCYSSGVPRLDFDSPNGTVGLLRLADPKVSAAELRDLLHKGSVWKEHTGAALARERFRESLLQLVPGAQRAGGVGRVYMPVVGLHAHCTEVVAAIARLAAEIRGAAS